MEQAAIFLIVAAFVAIRAMMKKITDAGAANPNPMPPPLSSGPVPLTDADRRYREIQEEIRRRIAQRSMGSNPPAPATPAPLQDYKPGRYATSPIPARGPMRSPAQPPPVKRAPPVVRSAKTTQPAIARPATVAATPPPPAPAQPVLTPGTDFSDSAYEFPQSTEPANAGSALVDDLRAALDSPNAAQRAFILKELFDRPLCLRPVWAGGHEDWN